MDEEHDTSEHPPHASKTTDGSSSGIDRIVARQLISLYNYDS
jgi:hypothetical protein